MTPSLRAAADGVVTAFWTTIYFVYFLFKGKREWKCGKLDESKPPNVKYCCVNDNNAFDKHQNGSEVRQRKSQNLTNELNTSTPKIFYNSAKNGRISGWLSSAWQAIRSATRQACHYVKCGAKKVWRFLNAALCHIWHFAKWLIAMISSNNVPSQALPAAATSTPKPFASQPSTPNYNKVEFKYDERAENSQEDVTSSTIVPKNSESFYYERVFDDNSASKAVGPSPPPPPPPPAAPAPPPVPPKPVSREPSRARSMTPGRERREVKGGIGGFKADIMDELEEQQRIRQERASVQREMTQSCHPDMAQWKAERGHGFGDDNETRASSVGPTMRRLEHIVSRLDTDNDDPSFVFRPKRKYDGGGVVVGAISDENSAAFLMGQSVFSPVEEAEQLRREINKSVVGVKTLPSSNSNPNPIRQTSYSSAPYQSGNWMENQRSRNIHRSDQIYDSQTPRNNVFGSAAYRNSPYSSHTARRSKTPVRFADAAAATAANVETIARQWPPASNVAPSATASSAPNCRNDWIDRSMRGNGGDGGEDDDGLVMTMCRRVVEKKREDSWKWRDENGRLLDEKNQNTWKGELDTLLRDGPNEGRHWSRTVEKLPSGDTRFQDVNRHYNKEFVVESVVRNY